LRDTKTKKAINGLDFLEGIGFNKHVLGERYLYEDSLVYSQF
jgi:hypothetical protein